MVAIDVAKKMAIEHPELVIEHVDLQERGPRHVVPGERATLTFHMKDCLKFQSSHLACITFDSD